MKETHLDGEDGVSGSVPDVAGGYDVDGEPNGDAVRRGDDGARAALEGGDRGLERRDERAELERPARGVELADRLRER